MLVWHSRPRLCKPLNRELSPGGNQALVGAT